jgi:thymidylate kinase
MKLITMSGVDGSGKSTQLNLLEERLRQEGYKTFYFHAVEFSAANRISRFFKRKQPFAPGEEKASTKASWFTLFLRRLFLMIDILRFRDLARKLRRERFDFILSDRYFYDSVINIEYLQWKRNPAQSVIARDPSTDGDRGNPLRDNEIATGDYTLAMTPLQRFIPRPDFAFYMDILAEEILKRERVPEQGLEYLRAKIHLFSQKKSAWHLVSIDATLDLSTIAEHIFTKIKFLPQSNPHQTQI